jgi:hypothetical protein
MMPNRREESISSAATPRHPRAISRGVRPRQVMLKSESTSEMNALERSLLEAIAADPPRQSQSGSAGGNRREPATLRRRYFLASLSPPKSLTNPQNTEILGPAVTIPEVPRGAVTIPVR